MHVTIVIFLFPKTIVLFDILMTRVEHFKAYLNFFIFFLKFIFF